MRTHPFGISGRWMLPALLGLGAIAADPTFADSGMKPVGMATCTVADIGSFPDRVHVRCQPAVAGTIGFFATETNGAMAATVTGPAMAGAAAGHHQIAVFFDPDAAANPSGCLAGNCRRLLGTSLAPVGAGQSIGDALNKAANAAGQAGGDLPAQMKTSCTVADIRTFPDRVHIQCQNVTLGSVIYFATEPGTTAAQQAQGPALILPKFYHSAITLTFNPNVAANPAGCLPTDCRRLIGTQ
jgi:hypothetical protein